MRHACPATGLGRTICAAFYYGFMAAEQRNVRLIPAIYAKKFTFQGNRSQRVDYETLGLTERWTNDAPAASRRK
ncbi:MAG: hypothetical protein WB919_19120 [Candidatus Sulfotelmatobacter sp.]